MLFTAQQFLAAPLERVFQFFTNPQNLPRLSPPGLKVRIEHLTLVTPPRLPGANTFAPLAGPGSEIAISSRLPLLPFRSTWVAQIVEFEWYRYFIDDQVRGPFRKFRHTHFFEAARRDGRDGTVLRDNVEWEVGWGIAHGIAAAVASRQLEAVWRYRHRAAEKLLTAES